MNRRIPSLVSSLVVVGGFTGMLVPASRAKEITVPFDPKDGPLPVTVSWWGQACVSIETFWGLTIVIDPYPRNDRLGYPALDLSADLVLVTHEHFDHTKVDAVKGKPVVLRGLTSDSDWARIDHYLDRPPNQPKPKVVPAAAAGDLSPYAVRLRGMGTYHDEQSGAQRGKNTMMLIEVDGLRILHCGDLGHVLTDAQLEAIGPVDLLLIPVGGTFTIDAEGALRVSQQVNPRRYTWPIHYNTSVGNLPLAKVDPFLDQAKQAGITIRKINGNTAALTRPIADRDAKTAPAGVIVSDFKPVAPGDEVKRALAAMRADRRAMIDELGKLSRRQLDHKPSDGTHTIRWNFEHTTGRELKFFSQVYRAIDPEIPVIDWNPAQMPPDYRLRNPGWDTAEMVRHVQRVGAFTQRFSYLFADEPVDKKIEPTRFSVRSLTELMVGHYQNHTTKAVLKFDVADWPKQ